MARRLCHTDLPSADSPLLSTQLSPVQLIPSLASLLTHTFCYFQMSAASCGRETLALTQTQVLVISTWILHSTSVHQIVPQFLLSDKKQFPRKGSFYQEDCWYVAVPGIHSGLSLPVGEILMILKAGMKTISWEKCPMISLCLQAFRKSGLCLRADLFRLVVYELYNSLSQQEQE